MSEFASTGSHFARKMGTRIGVPIVGKPESRPENQRSESGMTLPKVVIPLWVVG